MVIIHLKDFPSGRIYIHLNKKLISLLLKLIQKSNLKLDKQSRDQLYHMQAGQKVSLDLIKWLGRTFDIPQDFITQNIELITSAKNTSVGIRNPHFPLDFRNIEGGRLVAAIMGDGELNSQMQIRYNNKDLNLVNQVRSCAEKVFGAIDYKIYPREDGVYQLHLPKICGLLIIKLKLMPKKKVVADNEIPEFIFKAKKSIKAAFIAQFFSDEGNVRLKDRRLQVKQACVCTVDKARVLQRPERYASRVLMGLQKLLEDFGIDSKLSLSCYREHSEINRTDWELNIYGLENLEIFKEEIGFYLEYKNELLRRCLASYKYPSAPRNQRLSWALRKFRLVEQRDGYVTKYSLADACRRSKKTATYFLIDLAKQKKLMCVERPRDKLGHPMARKYALV